MDDPRQASAAYVHKDGVLAGTLMRTDRGTEFGYFRDYLDRGGIRVATTLPLTDEPLVSPGRSVPPFFAGLLPEGRRLTALRQTLKVSADDELSLLIIAGEDPAGDVSITPSMDPPAAPTEENDGRSWSDVRFADLLATRIVDPSSLAGVQDKVSGRMLTVPLIHGGRAHLLKLTPPELPHLIENEAFFLGHAARLPIPTVAWELVNDASGNPGLLITRFDRVTAGDGLDRLAVEDATQLLGLYPADKYTLTMEELGQAIAGACTSAPLAARAVFIQVAWAWLSGNGDLHGKNISIVADSSTHGGTDSPETAVAPVYDIPSTIPYGDYDLALRIDGRLTGMTRRRLIAFAARIGLPERAAISALETTIGVATGMIDDLRSGGSPWRGKARDDLGKAFDYRLGQLAR